VLTRPSAFLRVAILSFALSFAPRAWAFNMVIDYTYDTSGFFTTHTDAKASLEAAAGFFNGIILDNLAAITPSGGNTWSEDFFHPGTGAWQTVENPTVALGNFVVYAGAYDLGSTTLGEGGYGGYSSNGDEAWNTLVATRGEAGVDDSPPTDFANWGGSVSFDSEGTVWNFDHTILPSSVESDFFSVALHELGHVLGLSVYDPDNSWNTYQSGTTFAGPNVVLLSGSAVGTVDATDRHWAAGTMSVVFGTSTAQEAAMDPTLTVGTRKYFTELDVAALRDVGWMVVPEADSWQLLAIGGALVFLLRRQGRAVFRLQRVSARPSENSHGSLVELNLV
jgi:hypothetical protein